MYLHPKAFSFYPWFGSAQLVGLVSPGESDGSSTPRSAAGSAQKGKKSDSLQRLNKPGQAANPARTKADESWLMQRQLEVELSLRKKLWCARLDSTAPLPLNPTL